MDQSERMVDSYYSIYLDTDMSEVQPGTTKIVGSSRRLQWERGYGFTQHVWIMLSRGRCVVSAQPRLVGRLEGLFAGVDDYSILKDHTFFDKLLELCSGELDNSSLSCVQGVKYFCQPGNLLRTQDPNVKEITGALKGEVAKRLSEGGVFNLDYAVERKIAFAYCLDGSPVSFCLVHDHHSKETIDDVGGIFTLEEHRGKGYAKAVLAAATARIVEAGRTPVYGTSTVNFASQNTAKSAGYTDYAYQVYIR